MYWNLRVINDREFYYIAEVFYDKDNKISWTKPVTITGETFKECKEYYKLMKEAFKHPSINILELEDFKLGKSFRRK